MNLGKIFALSQAILGGTNPPLNNLIIIPQCN